MVASVGSSSGAGDALLAAYKKELAACVTCDSADTSAGKQAIQEAQGKVQEAATSIEQRAIEQSANQSTEQSTEQSTQKREASDSPKPAADNTPDPEPPVYSRPTVNNNDQSATNPNPETPLGLVVNLYA